MINIEGVNAIEVVKKAYLELITSEEIVSDPAVWKEAVASLTITNKTTPQNFFKVENDELIYSFPHHEYIPSVEQEKIEDELKYWYEVLIKTNAREILVNHLKENSNSRRALFNLWKSSHLENPQIGAACITQLYFRKKGTELELHTHARANDIHRCMLMDLQMMSSMHIWVAEDLGLSIGKHIHFVDALHLYKKHRNDIDTQIKILETSDVWN